jgi:hypothetical protein
MRRSEQMIIWVAWVAFAVGLTVGVVGLIAGFFHLGPGLLAALMPVGFVVACIGAVVAMSIDQRSVNRRLNKSGVRGYAIVRDCRQHTARDVESSAELDLLLDLVLGRRPPVTYRYTGRVPLSEIQRLARLDRVACLADPAKPDVIRIFPWDNPQAAGAGTGHYLQLTGSPVGRRAAGPSRRELLTSGHVGIATVVAVTSTDEASGDGTPIFQLDLTVTPDDGGRAYPASVDQAIPAGRISPGARLRCAYDPAQRTAVALDLSALID